MENYLVKYLIKTIGAPDVTERGHQTNEFWAESITNDADEIFTDLFEKHRNQGVVAIEIVTVSHLSFTFRPYFL